jgi:zinc transporter 1
MALSKSNRIILLLIIDTAFFLLELIVGYSVKSLALVADSFHMLNDVLSLCVGLWAVKVANQETNSKMYTYGWQRAETLGALVNGVFLVALCFSIFLEAIQRLVDPPVVENPKLVCIVGCLGFLSNIFGLVLFHDHSHGHDGYEPIEGVNAAEQGYNDPERSTAAMVDEHGTVAGVLPETAVAARQSDHAEIDKSTPTKRARRFSRGDETDQTVVESMPTLPQRSRVREVQNRHSRQYSGSTSRGFGNADNIQVHPAGIRQDIFNAASRFDDDPFSDFEDESLEPNDEHSRLLSHRNRTANYTDDDSPPVSKPSEERPEPDVHGSHNHTKPDSADQKGHGHSHGDLNMRGVFLHVMGDALGNIGVIASALIIWLTDYSWRFYVDPGISLVITVIILCSAIPLCKAASRILLQAVPAGMSIDHIKQDIDSLPGVISSHHLHVWQLSDTKLVASLHIKVDTQLKGEGSDRYMLLARQVRKCLHAYGIHSSTIQPEFTPAIDDEEILGSSPTQPMSRTASRAASSRGEPGACLLECGIECPGGGQCCPNINK